MRWRARGKQQPALIARRSPLLDAELLSLYHQQKQKKKQKSRCSAVLGMRMLQVVHEHRDTPYHTTNRCSPCLSQLLSAPPSRKSSFAFHSLLPLLCVLVQFVALHMAALLQPMRATGRHCHSAAVLLGVILLCFVVALGVCANVPSNQRTPVRKAAQFGWQRSKQCGSPVCWLVRF